MKGPPFKYRNEYWKNRPNDSMTDPCRLDVFNAVDTAIDRMFAPTIRLRFKMDDKLSDAEQRTFHRRMVAYYGSFANQLKFKPIYFCCRHNDFATCKNNVLDIFAHVPIAFLQRFEDRSRKWPGLVDTKHIANAAALLTEFDQVFSALSDQLHAARPHLPYRQSGLIKGPRTSYSRCLQWKYR